MWPFERVPRNRSAVDWRARWSSDCCRSMCKQDTRTARRPQNTPRQSTSPRRPDRGRDRRKPSPPDAQPPLHLLRLDRKWRRAGVKDCKIRNSGDDAGDVPSPQFIRAIRGLLLSAHFSAIELINREGAMVRRKTRRRGWRCSGSIERRLA